MAQVADHLSVSALEQQYRSCPDATASRHLQTIWLLAKGHDIAEVAATVLRDPAPLVPGCSYAETDSAETAPGLRLSAVASLDRRFRSARITYFDGRDLRLLNWLGRAE